MSEPVQYSPSPWLCLPPQLLDRLAAGAVELLERKVPPLPKLSQRLSRKRHIDAQDIAFLVEDKICWKKPDPTHRGRRRRLRSFRSLSRQEKCELRRARFNVLRTAPALQCLKEAGNAQPCTSLTAEEYEAQIARAERLIGRWYMRTIQEADLRE